MTNRLSAAPVMRATSQVNIISLTDVRNAGHANKVGLKQLLLRKSVLGMSTICLPEWLQKIPNCSNLLSCGFISHSFVGYAENCTATTDAKCSCMRGFLCSDNTCSKCEENKCVTGEKLKRTGENEHILFCCKRQVVAGV